jgi:signal transduction histidine kinase
VDVKLSGPQRLVLVVACASTAATVAFVAVPSLRFAYHAPEARIALETGTAIVALVTSYLMVGRFLAARRLDSLFLATGLAVLATTHLIGVVLLALGPGHDWRVLSVGGSFTGSLLIALAAVVPVTRLASREARGRDLVLAAVLVVGLNALLLGLDRGTAGTTAVADLRTNRPDIEEDAVLLGAQLAAMTFYFVAALGFARRAGETADRFLASLAVGVTLAGFARIHYALFAPTATGLVRTGDVVRGLFYAVMLFGAAREIESYWRGLAATAVLEERRRIARHRHDRVAQERAYIGRRAQRLAGRAATEIAASAERALNDSRRAIVALTRPLDRSLAEVLREALDDVAGRHGVELDLELERDVDVTPEAREALTRIACEAVANAARHGGAGVVRVELAGGDRVRFAVTDEGAGFDPSVAAPGRFGLTIMRERAEAIGGSFRVASQPGTGTKVEVVL